MARNIDFDLKQARYNLSKSVEILFNKKSEDRINVKVPYKSLKEQMQRFVSIAKKSRNNIISSVFKTDSCDDYTIGHSLNVCLISILVGDLMGYDDERLTELAVSALLHDIGKRLTPHSILYKGGLLTDEEFWIMKKHAKDGFDFMNRVYPEASEDVKRGILEHHERMDGKGYPGGLKWYEISEFARVIAIADVYEAYTSMRAYHDKRTVAEGINYIRDNKGLDKNIVDIFIDNAVFYPSGIYVVLSDKTIAIVDGNRTGDTPAVIIPGKNEIIDLGDRVIVDILSPTISTGA